MYSKTQLFDNSILILKRFYLRAKNTCMTQQNNIQQMTAKLKFDSYFDLYLCLVSLIYEALRSNAQR